VPTLVSTQPTRPFRTDREPRDILKLSERFKVEIILNVVLLGTIIRVSISTLANSLATHNKTPLRLEIVGQSGIYQTTHMF
jgi:hypothetical protein